MFGYIIYLLCILENIYFNTFRPQSSHYVPNEKSVCNVIKDCLRKYEVIWGKIISGLIFL